MAIAEALGVERFALSILALDGDIAALPIDPDDAGGVAVETTGPAVVANELYPAAGAELLLDLGERFGLVTTPSSERPANRFALRVASETVPASASMLSTL